MGNENSKNKIYLKKGAVVFKEGDKNTTAYIVDTGLMEVSRTFLNGKKKILAQLGPNEIFGELGLIDSQPRSATVTAVQDSSVTMLFKDGKIEALARKHPRVLLIIIKVLASRLRKVMNDVEGF